MGRSCLRGLVDIKQVLFVVILIGYSYSANSAMRSCELDSNRSLIQIMVYSKGPLATLTDNHIISTSTVRHSVAFNPENLSASSFEISIPVNRLSFDLPQLRKKAGPQFAAKVSSLKRNITRGIILGPEVLDAKKHPFIHLSSDKIEIKSDETLIYLKLFLKGIEKIETVPITLSFEPPVLHVSGSFSIQQHQYGIKPHRALLGGIVTKDELDVTFNLVSKCL